jgi:hypothetical protein
MKFIFRFTAFIEEVLDDIMIFRFRFSFIIIELQENLFIILKPI